MLPEVSNTCYQVACLHTEAPVFEVPCIRLHRKLREFGWKADRPSPFLCSRVTLNSLQMWVSWRITAQCHLQIGSVLTEGGSSCSHYGQHLPLGSSPWAPHKVLSSSCVRKGFVAAGNRASQPTSALLFSSVAWQSPRLSVAVTPCP